MGAASFRTGPVRLQVPATSANLGPGFDAFGIALSLADELTAEVVGRGLDVEVEGEGRGRLPLDESHLVVRAMRACFDRLDGQPPGLALRCTNRIPHGRGLGSSAAAIVGGVVAARSLTVEGERRMPDDDVLALAAALEGHPDNVAACLFGGFTIAWSTPEIAGACVRMDVDDRVRAVVYVPSTEVATATARGLLPAAVPHADASSNAGRAALLVAALTLDPALLLTATEDRLHQEYRAPAMPASIELVRSLREAGIAAVVSGAGPTVLALVVEDSLDGLLERAPEDFTATTLDVDPRGCIVTSTSQSDISRPVE